MTPEEVEQRVSTPVEQELLGLPHKTIVRSVSKYGISDRGLPKARTFTGLASRFPKG
jgi:hypothetical protein